jgi:Cu/Zn superoxide dismutase
MVKMVNLRKSFVIRYLLRYSDLNKNINHSIMVHNNKDNTITNLVNQ